MATLPQSSSAVLARAREFQRDGEVEFSLELLKRAKERDPSAVMRHALGRLLYEMGRPREAMAELVALLKIDSNHVEALLTLAESLGQIGEADRAMKMVDRAAELGAPAMRITTLRRSLGSVQSQVSDAIPFHKAQAPPQPRRTLLGLPHKDDGERKLPRIETGSFQALSAYDSAGASNEMSLLQEVPRLGRDAEFDSLLTNAGVPVVEQPNPSYRADPSLRMSGDFASPTDQTAAVFLSDFEASQDATTALVYSDHVATDLDETGYLPRMESPTEDELLFNEFEVDPTFEDDEGVHSPNVYVQAQAPVAAQAQVFFDENAFVRDHASVHQGHGAPSAPSPFVEVRSPVSQAGFGSPANAAPLRPSGWSSDEFPIVGSALPSSLPSADSPSLEGISTQMKVALGAALILLVFVIALVSSGVTEARAIENLLNEAEALEGSDSYGQLKDALAVLDKASQTRGFLRIALPGTKGPKLRAEAAAREAFVAAILNVKHAEPLDPNLDSRIRQASTEDPRTQAAMVLSLLAKGQTFQAAEAAAEARKAFPGNPAIEEVDVIARLALEQPRAAHTAVAPFRASAQTRRQELLVFEVDAMLRSEKAVPALEAFLKQNPKNVTASLALSELLKGDKATRSDAERLLTQILESEARIQASRLDIARISVALADVLVLAGDLDRAEEKFREASREVPERAQAYTRLIDFYLTQGRFDEIPIYLKRARDNGAVGFDITLAEARYLVRTGKPEEAAHALLQISGNDPRKQWWLGMSYLDMRRFSEATQAFKASASGQLGLPIAEALQHAAEALDGGKVEDAQYAIEKVVEKSPEDAMGYFARGLVLLRTAKLRSAEQQDKAFKDAAEAFEKAFQLDSTNERFAFGACEAHLARLDGRQAERTCLAGRRLNPNFVEGTLLTAHLRLLQGQIVDARDLIVASEKQRPDDLAVGILRIQHSLQTRDEKAAQSEINRWLSRETQNLDLTVLEGRLALMRGDLPRAAAYLEKAHAELPTHGEAAVFYGAVLAKLNKTDQAGDILKEVISHPTWGPHAWLYLGEVRRRQGKWKDATDNLAAAKREFSRSLGPLSRISLLQAEWAHYYGARYDWGHPEVLKALEAGRVDGDADEPELNLAYAVHYLKRKQPDPTAALDAFERVIRVAPYRCDAIQGALLIPVLNAKRRQELETARASACPG